MPVRRKQAKKRVEKPRLQKQLRLVAREAKRLDAHIQDLTKKLTRSHFRVL
jgi:hypothetical protein